MNTKYFILALLFPICIKAQDSKTTLTNQQKKAIESKKVDFINEKLNLNEEESKLFWPLYTKKNKIVEMIRKESANKSKEVDNNSDIAIGESLRRRFAVKQKLLDIERETFLAYQKVLSNKKIAEFYKAEKEFKKRMSDRLKSIRK
tara:strand:- start:1542 stop:1979 length:438 start_codon:yes stop_codon:yes gene_type:complete